jgi:hypothetical protein
MMGCMKETIDIFRYCPICGKPVEMINIYPFLTLEDWAGYYCNACDTWVDAFITPTTPSEVFTSTGNEAFDRVMERYGDRITEWMNKKHEKKGDEFLK